MVRFFRTAFLSSFRSKFALHLASAWLTGLLFGAFFACSSDPSLFLVMRSAHKSAVSIVGLLSSMLLPLLLTALAVYISMIYFLIPIAFSKACLYAYISVVAFSCRSTGGWLYWLLLLFGDVCSAPIYLKLWMQIPTTQRKGPLFLSSVAGVLIIGFLDFQYISPFLATILT